MSRNFFEDELRFSLQSKFDSQKIRELGDASVFFLQLMEIYPVDGSKINWSALPKFIEKFEDDQRLQLDAFAKFFDDVIVEFGLSGEIVYAGDSAVEFAIGGDLSDVREILPELLEIPHHHYFIASDFAWCVCLTMEGDMGFGFNPLL